MLFIQAWLDMSLEEQKVYIENRERRIEALKHKKQFKELYDAKKSLEIWQQKQKKKL